MSLFRKYLTSILMQHHVTVPTKYFYWTLLFQFASSPGKLGFTDEVVAVRAEAKRLQATGVNIIIAVGHAGYEKDLDVAHQVEEVDVVVGGHSNTFLYTGGQLHKYLFTVNVVSYLGYCSPRLIEERKFEKRLIPLRHRWSRLRTEGTGSAWW